MKERRLNWGVMLLAGSLFLLGRGLAATTIYSESEADVYLQCGGNELCTSYDFWMGDFDGDHFEDFLSPISSGYTPGIGHVFFGGDYPHGGSFPLFRNSRIERTNPLTRMRSAIGDITGDGIEDAFFLVGDRIFCVFGRPNPPALISSIDLTITGLSGLPYFYNQFAFGDVNGDGFNDLLIKDSGVYVVFGRSSFGSVSSTISVTDPSYCVSIVGVDYADGSVASGDVDGDEYDDIVLGDINRNEGARTNAGAVYVIRGRSSLPSTWDLRFSSADWTIVGTNNSQTDIVFVADFTGDGKADLGLKSSNHAVLLSGARVTSLGPKIDLAPGQLNSLTPSVLPGGLFLSGNWGIPSDFDGDGRPDLVVTYFQSGYKIALLLSHSFSPGSLLPEILPPPPLHFANFLNDVGDRLVLGDLNGDGKSDLIYQSETFPLLNVFYGYWPLENPKIVVQPRGSIQVRVQLVLSVDGEPTEMKISGDITDNFKDQWIPFQSRLEVTFSSEEEAKEVTAQFRNAFGRESAVVSAPWSVAVVNSGVVTGTNLLRPGGLVTFDCPVGASGSLRATVYDSNGELILDLFNQSVERGVYPVQWDGRNGQGYSVGKGVYFLVIDSNGERTKKEILIE